MRLPLRVKNVGGEDAGDVFGRGSKTDVLGTPPRKRAVPADEVHVRNLPEYASGKRSRAHRAHDVSAAHGEAKTLRIDHATRLSKEERYHREHQKAQSQRQWKEAFVRAFPKLVFYLDHIDASQKSVFTSQIQQLGGRVEDFFSRSVTHVVTTRQIPVQKEKENEARRTKTRAGIAPPRIVTNPSQASIPLHSDKNPLDDGAPALPASDLLCKAQHFGMKIWRQDKLQNILSLLLAEDAPADDTRQNLSEMLHQEKLHGTTERDPLALRSDYHYFGKHSYYVLVTDATNEHRPIAISEYDRTAHEAQHKPPPWPVLYGDVEGRGLFVYVKPKDRERLALQDAPPARPAHLSLRRTASLNLAGIYQRAPDSSIAPGTPNLMASDNSIALASTVASTTSTTLHSQGTQPGNAMGDKRLAELTRRMHTPVDLKQGAVVRRMLEDGPGLRRTKSTNNVPREPRIKEKRPGHCENCRCRFEDFDEHTRSRRHRKFAMDESNFVALDELLQRVQREPVEDGVWNDYTHQDTYEGEAAAYPAHDEYVHDEYVHDEYVAGSDEAADALDGVVVDERELDGEPLAEGQCDVQAAESLQDERGDPGAERDARAAVRAEPEQTAAEHVCGEPGECGADPLAACEPSGNDELSTDPFVERDQDKADEHAVDVFGEQRPLEHGGEPTENAHTRADDATEDARAATDKDAMTASAEAAAAASTEMPTPVTSVPSGSPYGTHDAPYFAPQMPPMGPYPAHAFYAPAPYMMPANPMYTMPMHVYAPSVQARPMYFGPPLHDMAMDMQREPQADTERSVSPYAPPHAP